MGDIFVEKICSVCMKYNSINCPKIIHTEMKNDVRITSCAYYSRNASKIKPYEKPLIVTAKRDYVINTER